MTILVRSKQFWLTFASVVMPILALAGTEPVEADLPSAYTQTVQRVVSARTEVVGAATELKANCAKEKVDCTGAALAYNKAKGAYDGWISVMKLAIKQGKARKLRLDDRDYRSVAEPAAKQGAAFLDYAEQTLTGPTKAAVPVIASVVDLGVKIWKEVSGLQQQRRDSEAEAFGKEVAWPLWADIK